MKNDSNWNTPLSQLFAFTSHLGDYPISSEGLEYEDYLRYFLTVKGETEVLSRFMDICEMDIRNTPSNGYFQMDSCIAALKAKANVSSGYGYGYQITREYAYE